jgi:hypothetical protein
MSQTSKVNKKQSTPAPAPVVEQPKKYVVFQESCDRFLQSWYSFILWEGNEKNLKDLESQLDRIDMNIYENMSVFAIDTKNLVSEQTAREMCKICINSEYYHRMYNGKLKKINLNLTHDEDEEEQIEKVNDVLGNQGISDFVDGEVEFAEHVYSSDSGSEDEKSD